MSQESLRRYRRYVAIGDSSTEGLDDPDGRGGYRGWANRLAEHLAAAEGEVLYANLAVRGLSSRQIRERQLQRALAMSPDLVTFFSGTNDVVSRRFSIGEVAEEIETVHRQVGECGAQLLTFTLPDLTPVMPAARRIAPRVAELNAAIRQIADRSGAIVVDFAAHPVASDPRLWSEDRLHANSQGHARIAAALAAALGLPGADPDWAAPLPERPPPSAWQKIGAEAAWGRKYLVPWLWRHLWGRSSGDGVVAKRPELEPLRLG
jgi:lysophospholipase L1-like esterase